MTATTGYQAGVESTNTQISYGLETAWGALPATQFQAIRYMSESLSMDKTRTRPTEMPTNGEAIAAVTTAIAAGGDVNFALSYGTFDDLMASALGNDWGTSNTITCAIGDLTFTTGTKVLTSLTAGRFTTIAPGMGVRTGRFTNAANNGFWRCVAKADNQTVTLAGPGAVVTETNAAAVRIQRGTLVNSNLFKSLFVQQKFSSSLYLRYPGCFVSNFQLGGQVGGFMQGKFTFLAQQEASNAADASTGGILAAPVGRVHDTVTGFVGAWLNNVPIVGTLDSFSLTVTSKGAALEYGLGSAAAVGQVQGVIEVSGQLKMYFANFTLYTLFLAETAGVLTFITQDANGDAYMLTLLNATLLNPKIEVGGPGQAVYVAFDIEANPQSAGGTIVVDRLLNPA